MPLGTLFQTAVFLWEPFFKPQYSTYPFSNRGVPVVPTAVFLLPFFETGVFPCKAQGLNGRIFEHLSPMSLSGQIWKIDKPYHVLGFLEFLLLTNSLCHFALD